MYAVIVTGGKQYRVKVGDVLAIEKLELEPGRKAQFDRVLLIEDGETVQVGTPVLDAAMVLGLVLEQFKDEKVLVFKKKRRKQFRRTHGHRQQLTKVRITRIAPDRTQLTAADLAEEKLAPVEKPAPAPKAKAPAPAEPPGREARQGGGQGQARQEGSRQAEGRKEAGPGQDEESDEGVSHGP